MGKRLSILRHAKSSWDAQGLSDHDRPLNKRGLRDAPKLGKLMQAGSIIPNRVISSTAQRAQETTQLVTAPLGFKQEHLRTDRDLYLASAATLIDVAAGCDDDVEHLMLVAHNPGMTDAVNRLGDVTLDNLPTCGIFCFEFEIDRWSELPAAAGRCVWHHYPKMGR